jgi:hypothetical protein
MATPGFDRLTKAIARNVAGTFRTTKGEDSIPRPTKAMLNGRREKTTASSKQMRKSCYPDDDLSRHRISEVVQGRFGTKGSC